MGEFIDEVREQLMEDIREQHRELSRTLIREFDWWKPDAIEDESGDSFNYTTYMRDSPSKGSCVDINYIEEDDNMDSQDIWERACWVKSATPIEGITIQVQVDEEADERPVITVNDKRYKLLEDVSPLKVLKAQGELTWCKDFQEEFKRMFKRCIGVTEGCLSLFDTLPGTYLAQILDGEPGWVEFLVENGFLEEMDGARFFKKGDRFIDTYTGNTYILATFGTRTIDSKHADGAAAVLVDVAAGWVYDWARLVKSVESITEEEIDSLTGGDWSKGTIKRI